MCIRPPALPLEHQSPTGGIRDVHRHHNRHQPPESTDPATRHRVALLAVVIALTSVLAVFGGLLWPEPAGGGDTYTYADIEPIRDLWWGLLTALCVLAILNIPTQALAALLLVRGRGATWATFGAALIWLGAGMQAAGVAAWAGAHFFPTDSAVDPAAGTAVIDAANQDSMHLFAVMVPGALLVPRRDRAPRRWSAAIPRCAEMGADPLLGDRADVRDPRQRRCRPDHEPAHGCGVHGSGLLRLAPRQPAVAAATSTLLRGTRGSLIA